MNDLEKDVVRYMSHRRRIATLFGNVFREVMNTTGGDIKAAKQMINDIVDNVTIAADEIKVQAERHELEEVRRLEIEKQKEAERLAQEAAEQEKREQQVSRAKDLAQAMSSELGISLKEFNDLMQQGMGFSLDNISTNAHAKGAKTTTKRQRKNPKNQKYRFVDENGQTLYYSGEGRKPNWFAIAMAKGMTEADLLNPDYVAEPAQ